MSEVADLWVKLSLLSTGFTEGLAKSGAEAEGFTGRMSKVGEGLATMTKAGVLAGAGMAAVSVKMAGDWQASMIKLTTSAGEAGGAMNGKLTGPIAQVSDGLLKMAVSTGTSTKQLADGMYFVESAGFHGAQGLQVMCIAAEGARAEGANLATVTDALTTALHDMGKGADFSVPMMNMMIRAVGDGKMTMEAFAGSLHSVLPLAHQAGIQFPDVAAAIATMTVAGTSADQATQMLGHTIQSLQNPNAQAVKWMSQMGISATDLSSNLGQRGLLGTITMVDQAILQHMGPDGMVLQSAFNQSKSASQDLNIMLGQMPPKMREWSQELENGSMKATDYSIAVKSLPANLQAQGQEFLTTYKNATSFNAALRSGTPDALTFAGMLRKVLGDTVDTNTALQLGGTNLSYYAQTANDVAKAGQSAGDHIETWATIQQGFNFRISQAKEAVETTAINVGTMLLPKLMDLFDLVTSRGGPALHQLESDVRNALHSSAVQQAEAAIKDFWHDFTAFLTDARTSVSNLWTVIQPVGVFVAGTFLLAFKATGEVLANIVGPAIEAVTGFLRDHANLIKVIAEVVLPALIGRLLILKGIEAFTALVNGANAFLIALNKMSVAMLNGGAFDAIKSRAGAAAGAVSNLAEKEEAAAIQAAGAAGAGGFGGFAGKLFGAVPIVGAAVTGVGMLSAALAGVHSNSDKASGSVDQFVVAMTNINKAGNTSHLSLAQAQRDMDLFRNSAGALDEALQKPDQAINKFEGSHITVELKSLFETLRTEIPTAMDPMAQFGVLIAKVNQQTGEGASTLHNYDDSLAKLVSGGQADRAAQLMSLMASVVDKQGNAVVNTTRDFPDYFKALDDLHAQQALGATATGNSTTALNDNANAALTNGASLSDLAGQLGGTTGATDALADSTSKLMQQQQDMSKGLNADRALDSYNRAVKSLTQSFKDNGSAITGQTDAAMNNRDALRNAVQAILDNYNAQVQLDGGTGAATKKLQDQINQLENVSGQSKATKDEVKKYIDSLNLIPKDVSTTINADTSSASSNIDQLNGKLKRMLDLEGGSGVTTTAPSHSSGGRPPPSFDHGGFVGGPKGAPQLAIVHGGEYVLSNDMLENHAPAAAPASAGGYAVVHNHITVQGSVITERDLRDLVQTQMLQQGARYSTSYTPYKR